MSDPLEYSEAVRIYTRWSRQRGLIDTIPSESASELVNGVWYLRNGAGLLARVGTRNRRVIER